MNKLSHIFFIIILLVVSCTDKQETMKQYYYFDLEGFFKKEADRLQGLNPDVLKTVKKNNETEQKRLKITRWSDELELFSASDVNKPAWKNSYSIRQTPGEISYTTTDPKLRTRKIVVKTDKNGKVTQIDIANKVSNFLYSSSEELRYFPDSLYQISKNQKVRLLGENSYFISGQIKNGH